jgi:insulysin
VCNFAVLNFWLKTTAGNYVKVVRAIFSYISLLKTSTSSFPPCFEEFRELSDIFFRNREKSQPHAYVISLTARLEEDPPAQWLLTAGSLYREYNEEVIKSVLDCLLPEKARLALSARDHENLAGGSQITWQKEMWYGTEYTVQKFNSEILEEVHSRIATVIANDSTKYLAYSHSRVAPTTP